MKKLERTGLIPRRLPYRDAKLYVIATEGQNTERDYFSIFQNQRLHVEVLSTGSDYAGSPQAGQSDPKHVLRRLEKVKAAYDLARDDELWLMVDVDRWKAWVLSEVCREARRQGFGLAISNPCFELWLVLHFQDADTNDTDGRALKLKLHKLGGSNQRYKLKLDAFNRSKIEEAIRRAEALDNHADDYYPGFPCTHVYKVVKSLIARMTVDFLR